MMVELIMSRRERLEYIHWKGFGEEGLEVESRKDMMEHDLWKVFYFFIFIFY